MAFAAADVPDRIDLLLDGTGYVFSEVEEAKAVFGYTPTFVTRQNVEGDFGDNFQDFWMGVTQRNWSGGENQRYWRTTEPERNRYWRGTTIDIDDVGAVKMRQDFESGTSMTTASATIGGVVLGGQGYMTSSANLYDIDSAGTSSLGAHGLGATPSQFGIAHDGEDIYISTSSAGSVGIRKYDTSAGTFSTFSAGGPNDTMTFNNNTLYAYNNTTHNFFRLSGAGAATSIFQFVDATGTAYPTGDTDRGRIINHGGKVVLMRSAGSTATRWGGSLWEYDGVGLAKLMDFPPNFRAWDVVSAQGIIFIGGAFTEQGLGGGGRSVGAILFYANGTQGVAWRSPEILTGSNTYTSLAPWRQGFLFEDAVNSAIMYYNVSTGGVHSYANPSGVTTGGGSLTAGADFFFFLNNSTQANWWPKTSLPTSAQLRTSLYDFDSSLTKAFHGVTVDFDDAYDGNGGSVDIAWLLNDVIPGSYTTLQADATSGTEYTFTNQSGRAIGLRITLNKGTSTAGPTLKRIGIRAAPKQATFKKNTYVLNLGGRDGDQHVQLRDGTLHPQDGLTMAQALITTATTQNSVSITDEFGTFTGVIDNEGLQIRRNKKEEYIAVVPVRSVT